jgi:LPS export ABC transporter protein LptC
VKYALLLKNAAVIFCLIGMIWWFHLQNRSLPHDERHTKPQEYMAKLTITNFNEVGKPKEKLQADYWAFVPNNGRSDLRKPYVTIYKANGDVWYLSAKTAMAFQPTLADKITEIDLLDNVVIERSAENHATPTKITTESLQYFPKEEKVTSSDYISMLQPGIMVSGKGMLGYLDKNWIELHDDITTVYYPNAK